MVKAHDVWVIDVQGLVQEAWVWWHDHGAAMFQMLSHWPQGKREEVRRTHCKFFIRVTGPGSLFLLMKLCTNIFSSQSDISLQSASHKLKHEVKWLAAVQRMIRPEALFLWLIDWSNISYVAMTSYCEQPWGSREKQSRCHIHSLPATERRGSLMFSPEGLVGHRVMSSALWFLFSKALRMEVERGLVLCI